MEQKDYIFEKLTPDNDVDISVYDEAIGFVFDNEDVTNIAISGAYGAGKSSVIKSYEKKHEEKKFMHISLAHFEPMDVEEENDAKIRIYFIKLQCKEIQLKYLKTKMIHILISI